MDLFIFTFVILLVKFISDFVNYEIFHNLQIYFRKSNSSRTGSICEAADSKLFDAEIIYPKTLKVMIIF